MSILHSLDKVFHSAFVAAIGSALSPDYSYSITQQDHLNHEREKNEMSRTYEPNPADTSKFVPHIINTQILFHSPPFSVVLTPTLEDFVRAYAESVHDQWSYAKVTTSRSGMVLTSFVL